ncbi:MAG: L-serine ammonia-lyase [Alphaproteobacteria bacterium]|nr:L-serine ammonia-lyase [Alphaproteobacteria bacterium]
MYYSFFEIFSIGIGPSSSHTVGPMRAAKRFIDNLHTEELFERVTKIDVTIYGSLALTGVGHGTVKAIVYGLMGLEAEKVNPEIPYVNAVKLDKILHLAQEKPIAFDLDENVIFKKDVFLPEHSNGMKFEAYSKEGQLLLSETYFSIGGGTVVRQDAIAKRVDREPLKIPHDFNSFVELQKICEAQKKSIAEIIWENECALRPESEVKEGIFKIREIMQNAIDRGMKATGILNGGLNLPRKANGIYQRLEEKFRNNEYDPLLILDWLSLWGFAVAEENAAGGQIVTAPTMGSAGIMPSVLRYFERFAASKSPYSLEDGILKFLLTASGICSLYRSNASISGAEVGCQGEVGVACSISAAGLCAAMGGSILQVEASAEIAMEHNLGLTCDPVAGLVQIPCIERNAMGAVKAVTSARMGMKSSEHALVPLDTIIKTMMETGRDMNNKYKETALGGLAVSVATC